MHGCWPCHGQTAGRGDASEQDIRNAGATCFARVAGPYYSSRSSGGGRHQGSHLRWAATKEHSNDRYIGTRGGNDGGGQLLLIAWQVNGDAVVLLCLYLLRQPQHQHDCISTGSLWSGWGTRLSRGGAVEGRRMVAGGGGGLSHQLSGGREGTLGGAPHAISTARCILDGGSAGQGLGEAFQHSRHVCWHASICSMADQTKRGLGEVPCYIAAQECRLRLTVTQ